MLQCSTPPCCNAAHHVATQHTMLQRSTWCNAAVQVLTRAQQTIQRDQMSVSELVAEATRLQAERGLPLHVWGGCMRACARACVPRACVGLVWVVCVRTCAPPPHLHRGCAQPATCTTSASGLDAPCHVCSRTALTAATSAWGLQMSCATSSEPAAHKCIGSSPSSPQGRGLPR
jgi:hypothetical protein